MSDVDLRTEKTGGTWVRRLGDHETAGMGVSVNDRSVHVTLTALGVTFAVDRQDVPAAWDKKIDVVQLRAELLAAIVRRMSAEVVESLLQVIHYQRQRAFWEGERATQIKIREALGL